MIILASRSKARRRLLKKAGLRIKIAYADADESRRRSEPIGRYAMRVAIAKAKKVEHLHKGAIIIAADTAIAIDSHIFGKPKNNQEAEKFLKKLSGRWHKVYTGTVVIDAKTGRALKKLVISRVKFEKLSQSQIDWYIGTGEPLRAAGAYSIQGKGGKLIEKVEGCFTNVVGISVPIVMKMLKTVDRQLLR